MAATIEVNKQSVKDLLETGKDHPFVIPEYQRPYAWSNDEIDTLFDDLWEFTENSGGSERNGTYFLGSIVSYQNEHGEQEIIDGQQRITSLFLLLRAIYTMLKTANAQNKKATNFINQIEPAIWRTNKLTGEVNYSDILLESRVVNSDGNAILKNILESGTADKKATDNYSVNYLRLQHCLEEAAKQNPLEIYDFIYALLNQAILLPISADTQDTALTIFSTLNDRGMPLSDADIFKAGIYNKLSDSEKREFIREWQDLDEKAGDASESIQQLFYYYMFYLRATEDDVKTTTPGLRRYFSDNKSARLLKPELLDNLQIILNLWLVVTNHEVIDEEAWSSDKNILQALDVLKSYPNEFWKYPVVIYYLSHRTEPDFKSNFLRFLRKLLEELLTKYLFTPTINAVKTDILKLDAEIIHSSVPKFDFRDVDMSQLSDKIKDPHRNAVRMLLKILAYDKQKNLLPDKWEIEHIFPQKWQANYFPDASDDVIKEKIEHIGNKLPFEKRLNIVAGNGYFTKKQKEYAASKISITKAMAVSDIHDWDLDSIVERDIRVSDEILRILKSWDDAYKNVPAQQQEAQKPSAEQQALIERFKKNGWV